MDQNTRPFTPYQNIEGTQTTEPVTFGGWIGVLLLPLINIVPCIGIIAYYSILFVWGFGSNAKPSLKNYARASLLLSLIGIVFAIIGFIGLAATGNLANITDNINQFRFR